MEDEKAGGLATRVPEGVRLARANQDERPARTLENLAGDPELDDPLQDEVGLLVAHVAVGRGHPPSGRQSSLHEGEATLGTRVGCFEPHLAATRDSVQPLTAFPTEQKAPPCSVKSQTLECRAGSQAKSTPVGCKNILVNGPIPPGWHTDPADASSLRWWDGTQWTNHTSPAPRAAPGPLPPGVVPAGYTAPPGYTPQPSSYSGQPPGGPGQPGYASAGQAPPAAGVQQPIYANYQPAQGSLGPRGIARGRGPNSFSLTAIGFAALYLVLALTTNFVLLGIVPVVTSVRAFQRGEKLAPLAALAAAVTVATAVYFLGFHHR